jgi:hypothetical protein
VQHGIDDDQILNMDEMGVWFEMQPSRTYTLRGERVTRGETTGASKKRLTVLLCCAASGRKLPPLLVFKGTPTGTLARALDNDGGGYPAGVVVCYQPNAWCDRDVMSKFANKMYDAYPLVYFILLFCSSPTASQICDRRTRVPVSRHFLPS